VEIGAVGPHIADGSWELDAGVIQCFGVDFLVEGCGPRRCGPQRCGPPGGVDLAAYSAYLDCFFCVAACIALYSQM
jgi:hypothetical protein